MKLKKNVLLICWTGLALVTGPWASWAGDTGNEASMNLKNIIVTANKIEENMKDVPQSITVIDEYILEEKGIKNIADVIGEIPNMKISHDHGNSVNFRGLNASMFTSNNPVVIYIDGVPCADRFGFDASLANVERIEVLRGPQGTLYGKDAIGGVINIVTRDPENVFRGKAEAEYGSFNSMRGVFNGSGPLIRDTLYLGINGQYKHDDGWIDNTRAGMDEEANEGKDRRISGYLLYKPTGRLRARLTLSNDYSKGYWMDGYGLPGGSSIDDFDRDDAEQVDFDMLTYEEYEADSQSLNLVYDFDAVTLTSTTTHRKLNAEGEYDVDFGNNALYAGLIQFDTTEIGTWTQELRLSGNNDTGLRWIGGVYYDNEKRDQGPHYGYQFPNYDPSSYAFIGNYEMNAESKTDSSTCAVFGQVIVPLGSRFEATLGGRYQHIDKEIDLSTYYRPVGTTADPMFVFNGDKSWDVFLPKVALSCKINRDWTTFAAYSQGYMPGGFNYMAMSGTEDDNSFEPQRSTNYEIGIKGGLNRFSISASLFYMDIEDIHVYKSLGTTYLTDNADGAHSQGVELELIYRMTDTIELSAAGGLISAEYDDYDAGSGVIFDGEKIQNTPSYTARLGVAYLHPNGFYSRIDIKSQGEVYYYDDVNKDFVKADDYTLMDARIGYRTENWDFYLYGNNLTDESYVTEFKSSAMFSIARFGTPRTVGAGVRYRF